eukprot:TRINITY_DN55894_c0_g1_i1.p1 TRINITY_DN55894_c0_g1~~TRINITY_DN55894_c0_g1_i1.p1  ORF type:complete len:369 (-),score=85.63 TRINITY_DN55894_c0_g1_i1:130-1236(-)
MLLESRRWQRGRRPLPRGGGLASILVLACSCISCQGTFKGFVNPLRHYDPETGKVFLLNLTDSEPGEELLQSIKDFIAREDEHMSTLLELSRHRVGRERCQPALVDTQNIWPLIDRLRQAGVQLDGRYVNIGAADGQTDDPLFEYARQLNATGVAVERDPKRCARHREALPLVDVQCTAVTPQNVVDLVASSLPPPLRVDVLKVDIDSYDCPVLEVLLERLTAKIVIAEVNPSVPPPYQWAMLHHPQLWDFFDSFHSPEEVPIRGCSLAYEVDLMRRFGYDFVAFGGHDALFTHSSVRAAWSPLVPPMDEFDCYNEAFIAANGIPIAKTRRWFFEQNDTQAGLPEIWDFFAGWMQENSPRAFPFALRG